ncbi:MAG: PIN domain-containing protein [Gammaproteobacteria bacterium]
MIHVVLDTNIYREKPRLDSAEFKTLVHLSNNNCIRIHVPFFVEKEFCSHLEIEQAKHVDSAIRSIKSILNYDDSGETTEELNEKLQYLIDNKETIVKERSGSFINWLDSIHAERYELTLDKTSNALDAYFEGKSPLPEPKIRKHIPDSFIYQDILEIKGQFGDDAHAVIGDKNLRNACENEGLDCSESLIEFLKLDEIKDCISNALINDNYEAINNHVLNYVSENQNLFIDKVEELLLSDDYRLISGDMIPGEMNEIWVSGADRPIDIEFDELIEYYGNGLFVLDFRSSVEFIYEYPVHRHDISSFDTDKYYIQPHNEYYFNVETTDLFNFIGKIELEYDINFENIDNIQGLLQSLTDPEIIINDLDEFEIAEAL